MMMKSFRSLVVSSALSAALLVAVGSSAYAAEPVCQPGIATALAGPRAAQYSAMINLLVTAPVVSAATLTADLAAVVDQTTYAVLLTDAQTIAGAIATGRVVITLPDGTVVVDTGKNNNTYANYLAKAINENHNSRVAILAAQSYSCGYGLETKLSSTVGQKDSYFAERLGAHLDSVGTARLSTTAP